MISALASLLWTTQVHTAYLPHRMEIDTTSGRVQGVKNETTPDVAQFLGIPFAEKPIDARRWLPPIAKRKQPATIDATKFGAACAQWEVNPDIQPNMLNVDVPEFGTQPFDFQSEDCLSVNIWTPWYDGEPHEKSNTRFPVVVWLYGGGFAQGGANVPYQNPAPWVQRSKKHIVVSINYRVGLLGFPNSKALPLQEQNLGLLDQRLGLEWVRDNIAKFGGDPARIALMGQSAGAMSADYDNFAYPGDAIASSYIMHSGTAHVPFANTDTAQSNFTFVASQFNCKGSDAQIDIDCLRNISAVDLMSFLKKDADDNGGNPTVSFNPIIDNRTLFEDADYTARALAGKFTRKPVLAGTTKNDGAGFVLPYNATYGPAQADADEIKNWLLLCPTVKTSKERFAANATTFRYLYAGNFSNIAPRWWQGAYHSSDLPLVFGTYDIARGKGSEFERQVSENMQDLWLTFVEDPTNGLPRLGWKAYRGGHGEAVLIGEGGKTVQFIAESVLDAPCNGTMPPMNHHML